MIPTPPLAPLLLESLRVFDSAARLGSFKAAAAELGITPAAVSQRIRSLERRLGSPLFVRGNRSLIATPEARRLAVETTIVLERLGRAIAAFAAAHENATDELSISAPTSFAVKWLGSRLTRFRQAYPAIRLRIDTSDLLTVLGPDSPFDIVIRYTAVRPSGDDVHVLGRSGRLVPVVASNWLVGSEGSGPLLHTQRPTERGERPTTDWVEWRACHPNVALADVKEVEFSNVHFSIAAAISGNGVALAPDLLISDDLFRGTLRQAALPDLWDRLRFWIVVNPQPRLPSAAQTFRDWLLKEAEVHETSDLETVTAFDAELSND